MSFYAYLRLLMGFGFDKEWFDETDLGLLTGLSIGFCSITALAIDFYWFILLSVSFLSLFFDSGFMGLIN